MATGSKSLVEIEGEEDGVDVAYLKQILNQAKLYIRTLPCDVTDDTEKVNKLFYFYLMGLLGFNKLK